MSALPNAARGESVLHVDGRPLILCLTLGALARLETAFCVRTMAELEARLRDLSGSDLLVVVSALIMADGESLTPDQLAKCHIDPAAAASAIAQAFERAGA
jgi:Phage tail tube protein, GTA-gp10